MRYKDTSLREERDRALFEAYEKALETMDFSSQGEAIEYVCCHQAPRFFIDGDFCAIVIGRMLKGLPTGLKGEKRERKYQELLRLYLVEREKPGNESLSKHNLCHKIVNMPAPEFYINSRAAFEIIKQQMQRRKKYLTRFER